MLHKRSTAAAKVSRGELFSRQYEPPIHHAAGAFVDVMLTAPGPNQLVAASFAEGRIAVASLREQRLVADIALPQPAGPAFDISADHMCLITAYYYRPGIDVWDVPTGRHRQRVGRFRGWYLVADATGSRAVIWGRPGCGVDLATGSAVRIPYLASSYGADFDPTTNCVWVTSSRRRVFGRYWFDLNRHELIEHANDETVWAVRVSSITDRIVLMSYQGRNRSSVACYRRIGDSALWVHRLSERDLSSIGSFTGDGRRFFVSALSAKCTIVLDALTGEEITRFPFVAEPRYPIDDRFSMTSDGRIVDTVEGRLSDCVNRAEWWRKAGLGSRDLRH